MTETHKVADARNIEYGSKQWWGATVQSYATWKASLGEGSELNIHHLLPKTLLRKGPPFAHELEAHVPSVPLAEHEHLSSVHTELNRYLKSGDYWTRPLSAKELDKAIQATAAFYSDRGLKHFSAAIREFRVKVYIPASGETFDAS